MNLVTSWVVLQRKLPIESQALSVRLFASILESDVVVADLFLIFAGLGVSRFWPPGGLHAHVLRFPRSHDSL